MRTVYRARYAASRRRRPTEVLRTPGVTLLLASTGRTTEPMLRPLPRAATDRAGPRCVGGIGVVHTNPGRFDLAPNEGLQRCPRPTAQAAPDVGEVFPCDISRTALQHLVGVGYPTQCVACRLAAERSSMPHRVVHEVVQGRALLRGRIEPQGNGALHLPPPLDVLGALDVAPDGFGAHRAGRHGAAALRRPHHTVRRPIHAVAVSDRICHTHIVARSCAARKRVSLPWLKPEVSHARSR